MAKTKEPEVSGVRFCREALLQADCLKGRQDLVMALLSPEKSYTLQEAEEQINQFLKGKVN